MSHANSCPCVVRVAVWVEPKGRKIIFIRLPEMKLSDGNERHRYRDCVLDDEVERCFVEHRDGEVDCVAWCNDGVRGVEFKSYVEGVDLDGMRRELSRKRVLGRVCQACVLVIPVFKEDVVYILERAQSSGRRVGVAYSVRELLQKICGSEIVLLVVAGAGGCG